MRQFDTKTNEIIEKYVAVMARRASCLKKTQPPCTSICETCQTDYNQWVRSSITKELARSLRTIELYAPHLLK